MPGKYLSSSLSNKRCSLFKHLSNHPLRSNPSPLHAETLPPLQSGENVSEKFRLLPLIPLVFLWLLPFSPLLCVQARRRTRLAPGKGRVEPLNYVSERKRRGGGGWIQARRLGRVYKYVLLLARCRGGSPDLPVNFVIPFATSPTNPCCQPSAVSLGANPLRNYGGASVMRVATGDAWWTVFLVCKRGDGEKWVVSKEARGLDSMCLTMI